MAKNLIIAVLVVSLITGGVYFFLSNRNPEYKHDVAIGDNTLVYGSYNYAVGDNLTIDKGECQIKTGPFKPDSKALASARYLPLNKAAFMFDAFNEIEKHCKYKKFSLTDTLIKQLQLQPGEKK